MNKKRQYNWRWASLTLLLLCAAVTAESTIQPWQPLFQGVELAHGQTDTPRLQKVTAVRIDLQDPNIAFCTTDANGPDIPGDTTRETGAAFVTRRRVQVAINAHFYTTTAELQWKAELHGLCINEGQVVAAPEALPHAGASLLITKDNHARLEYTTPESDFTDVWTAIEAWPYFLQKGTNTGDPTKRSIHPRSAVGLTEDGRYLILMTIDGRQKGYSMGATYQETAAWLQRFGAHEGLNIDGGGSTHLLISDGAGGAKTLNRPSENRKVASHLGVFAAELPREATATD